MMKFLMVMVCFVFAIASKAQSVALKEAMGDSFLIGCAINDKQVLGVDLRGKRIVVDNFNSVVAENCMKGETIHPEEDRYDWNKSDAFVQFGEQHGMAIIGHCLVWHSQAPKWMFIDDEGNEVSRDTLINRMRRHITTVVSRYRGKIHGWDVVNEAVNDDGSFRESPYLRIIGPEYIELAFKFANEADSDAELYYNDYSMSNPSKRDAVCRLVRSLKEKGYRIDAVGMQSHNGVDYPRLEDYEAAMDSFANCGVKVMITELDLNMLPSPSSFSGADVGQSFEYEERMNPYKKGLSSDAQKDFDERYLSFFDIYRRHSQQISRVCLWGVTDGDSWLNDWPVRGRTNYPLLFDRNGEAKPVVSKIVELFR